MKLVLIVLFVVVNLLGMASQDAIAQEATLAVPSKQKTWGDQPKDSLIKPLLNKYVVNEVINLHVMDGHHYNLKANNSCDTSKPSKLEANFMQCQFDEPGMKKINAYICDEKETFCKFEKINVLVTAPRGYKKDAKRVSSNIIYVPKAPKKAPPGFIKNRDKFAFEQAKKKDQPILVVFAAQWCPACNMLDENVFVEKEFKKLSKDLVKLVVDVDSDVSWELKEKFKVGAYPTTVLMTPARSEIGRFIGYRSPSAVNKWLKDQLKNKKNPIELVVSKFQNNAASNDEILRLAQWQLDRDEPAAAKITLLKLKSPEAKKLIQIADYRVYEAKGQDEESAKVLVELIKKNPSDVLVSQWASSLSQKDVKEAKKLKDTVAKNVETWTLSSDKLGETAFTAAELFYNLGEYYSNISEPTLAGQSFSQCADVYKKLSAKSNLKIPRGAQMEQAFCLVKAGKNESALGIFKSLVDVYKTEFAFNYYYARSLLDTGDLDKAYTYARNALKGSYGDNMIRAAILKAQIEIEKKNLDEAEKTLSKTLEKIYLPSTTQIRSHRYVSSLKNVLANIQVQKEALKVKKEEESKKE